MAAKKSFKGTNPAMQFISIATEEASPVAVLPQEKAPAPAPEPAVQAPQNVQPIAPVTPVQPVTPVRPVQAPQAPPVKKAPAVPERKQEEERKTKRLNLLLQPSVLEDLAKIAHMQKTSVNDLINTVLKAHCKKQSALVHKYEDVFGE